jgi:SPP1 gp7 family putative phage head morphogenesis protein
MPTTNDELLDRQLVHATYTQRYGTGLARRVLRVLGDAEADLRGQIEARLGKIAERGFDLGPTTTKRLESLLNVISATRKEGFANLHTALKTDLLDFVDHESDFQRRVLESVIPVPTGVNAPSRELLRSIVVARPFQGRVLRQWVGDLENAERKAIRSAINIGMVEGESIPNITGRITDRFNQTQTQATAIVRTAVNHVSNHARDAVAQENQDVIKGVQWLSTLDGRTSAVCRARDKKVFPVDSGPRPPAHFNCRSTITYVLKSWQEMGLEGDDLPVGVRASMNGDVPADLSYGDWLRKQPRAFVFDTLGRTKGQLFLDGNLKIERFIDRNGGELTLDQLKAREAKAWAKAFNQPTERLGVVTEDKAIDYVRRNGQRTLTEHAVIYDGAGNALVVKQGARSSVSFTQAEIAAIRRADSPVVVHNHPNGTTLSGADLVFAAHNGVQKIVAVGTDELSRFEAAARASGSAIRSKHALASAATESFLRSEIGEGRLSREGAGGIHFHTVNQILHESGAINYLVVAPDRALEKGLNEADTQRLTEFIRRKGQELAP